MRERLLNIATESVKSLIILCEQFADDQYDKMAAMRALAELDKMRRPNPGEQK